MNIDEEAYARSLPEEVRATWEAMPEEKRAELQAHVKLASEHMKNVVEPMLAFKYPQDQLIVEAEQKHGPHYSSFEFESVRLIGIEIETVARTARCFTETISGDVALEMVCIPSGEFAMGSSLYEGETPIHSVAVPAFHLGKYEITQRQWKAVMQHNLSANKGDELPVDNVSWLDANEFCNRLSLMTGREYRLPSEAEWEYACRAGTTTLYSFGDDITPQVANYWDVENVEAQEPLLESVAVGSFYPNDFGLYDMHGNVYELCQDTFQGDYTDAPTDGSAWLDSKPTNLVVIRGGSCVYYADNCRSAYRTETAPDYRYGGTGFRVACSES